MPLKPVNDSSRLLWSATILILLFCVGCAVLITGGNVAHRASGVITHNPQHSTPVMAGKGLGVPETGTFPAVVPASRPALIEPDPASRARVMQSFAARSQIFEANQGQTDSRVKYLSRGSGYELFLTGNEAVLELMKSGVRSQKPEVQSTVDSRQLTVEERNSKFATRHSAHATRHFSNTMASVLRMKLVGANASAGVRGLDEQEGKANYFIGDNPAQWRTNVPTYAKVKYASVYPGVDLVYYGNQRQLEYDFVVAPGANPAAIAMQLEAGNRILPAGISKTAHLVTINSSGNIIIETDGGEVRFHKPVVYQEQSMVESRKSKVEDRQLQRSTESRQLTTDNGPLTVGNPKSKIQNRKFIDGAYVLRSLPAKSKSENANYELSFRVAEYDHALPLIIDPVLSYSTFLGGNKDDLGNAIAVDAAGSAYVAGSTLSPNFPITPGSFQAACPSCATNGTNAFVTKFNSAGSALVYSTYLGGNGSDSAAAIALDAAGNAFLTGTTLSTNFPTMTPYQAACSTCLVGQPDAFVTKLNAAGSALIYSTYLGGSRADQGAGIAVDSAGSAYVTGTTLSDNFPTVLPLQGACQGCASGGSDAFVTKLSPTGNTLVYSTFIGGSGADQGLGIAVDAASNAYVTGRTQSNNFPVASAFQTFYGGNQDGFISKLNATGSALLYSTYIGGSGSDDGRSIALDSAGNAYVTGSTSSANFPTANAFQPAPTGSPDAYVLKLNGAGTTLLFSTYLGGAGSDAGNSIAVDSAGNAYVAGFTNSLNFPTANPVQAINAGNQDAFVTKLNSTGAAIIFSTFLGGHDLDSALGIAVDATGNAYVTGQTFSNDFPVATAFQPATGGSFDAFVTKLGNLTAPAVTLSPVSLTFPDQAVGSSSTTQNFTLTNNGDSVLTVSAVAATGDFSQTNTCVGSVASGGACSITVTFAPTAPGTRTGTVTITDNASGSPHTVNTTGKGIAPIFSPSVGSLSFGNQGVGIASAPQTITLSNPGTSPLAITSVAISSGFIQTNTCGSSVAPVPAPASTCTFTVTFTPTVVGQANGALTVNDNASGSPHTIPLSGNGVPAFSLSATPTSQTISKGTDSTTFTITAASQFGFTSPITLACANNAPTNCAFNPATVTPGQTSALTITNIAALGADTLNFVVTGTSGSQSSSQTLSVLMPNFVLAVTPPSQAVSAGKSAIYTVSLVPVNNFNQAVNLACTGAPLTITCTINPTSVTLSGGSATTTAILTVTTTARAAIPGTLPKGSPPRWTSPLGQNWFFWLFSLGALLLLATSNGARRTPLGFAMATAFVLLWAACSVGSNISNGTPPGSYSLAVKATTTGTLQNTTSFGVTVN